MSNIDQVSADSKVIVNQTQNLDIDPSDKGISNGDKTQEPKLDNLENDKNGHSQLESVSIVKESKQEFAEPTTQPSPKDKKEDSEHGSEKPVESIFKKAAESGSGFAGFASVEKSSFLDAVSRFASAESTDIFSQSQTQNESDSKSHTFNNGSWLPSSNSIFAQRSNFGSFSSRLSSAGSIFSSQADDNEEEDPEAERPTSFPLGSQNPNYVPIQENIVTGEEEELIEFSKDGILYMMVDQKWVSRGKTQVKLNRNTNPSAACPARLIIRQPGTHKLMLNQPLNATITSPGQRPDQPQCLNFTTATNDKADLYALKFKEEEFTHDFFIKLTNLKEYYQKSKPANDTTNTDTNGKLEDKTQTEGTASQNESKRSRQEVEITSEPVTSETKKTRNE